MSSDKYSGSCTADFTVYCCNKGVMNNIWQTAFPTDKYRIKLNGEADDTAVFM